MLSYILRLCQTWPAMDLQAAALYRSLCQLSMMDGGKLPKFPEYFLKAFAHSSVVIIMTLVVSFQEALQ